MMAVIERQGFIMGPEVGRLEAEIARLSHTKARRSPVPAEPTPCYCRSRRWTFGPAMRSSPRLSPSLPPPGTVHNAGGTPVFVDIDPATFNISPAAVEAAVTPRTRAIIVVHLFGQMAADGGNRTYCCPPRAGPVIEDGAQSIGARRKIDGTWRMSGRAGLRRDPFLLPDQEPRRLGRCRAHGDPGRRVGRAAAAGSGCTGGRDSICTRRSGPTAGWIVCRLRSCWPSCRT